jgi:hypothetical protein
LLYAPLISASWGIETSTGIYSSSALVNSSPLQ